MKRDSKALRLLGLTAAFAAFALVFAFLAVIQPPQKPVVHPLTSSDKSSVLALVNVERAKVGVPPLTQNANMNKAAQLKSDDMSVRDYQSHIIKGTDDVLTPEMSDLDYAQCSFVSENFYWGVDDSRDAASAMYWWMNSKPHHDAILDPKYTLTGIGISGTYKVVVVQHFCVAK